MQKCFKASRTDHVYSWQFFGPHYQSESTVHYFTSQLEKPKLDSYYWALQGIVGSVPIQTDLGTKEQISFSSLLQT